MVCTIFWLTRYFRQKLWRSHCFLGWFLKLLTFIIFILNRKFSSFAQTMLHRRRACENHELEFWRNNNNSCSSAFSCAQKITVDYANIKEIQVKDFAWETKLSKRPCSKNSSHDLWRNENLSEGICWNNYHLSTFLYYQKTDPRIQIHHFPAINSYLVKNFL